MNGFQCDTCRKFALNPAGWFYLGRQPLEKPTGFPALFGTHPEEPKTFCSVRCVAEYAYVQAVADEAGTETQP